MLAACGAIATAALLAATPEAGHGPVSTALQLGVVAVLLVWLGPRGARRSMAASSERRGGEIGSGEPTPLWHIAAIVAILAGAAGLLAGWDAGIRVTVGCVLVGVAQALLLGDIVRREEHRTGRTFYRTAGSRILRGTRLLHVPRP